MKRLLLFGFVICGCLTFLFFANASHINTQAQTIPVWQPNVAYSIGNQVTYQDASHPNHLYKCQQAHTSQVGWEPPNTPALWIDEGAYGGATATNTAVNTATTAPTKTNTPANTATNAPTKTNTPIPTSGPTATKTSTAVPPTATTVKTNTPVPPTSTIAPTATSSGTGCWPAWNSSTAYGSGSQVSYNGHNWTANQWNQNEVPGGPAGAWNDSGPCGGSGPTFTPVPPTKTPAPVTNTPTFVPATSTPSGPTPTKTNTPIVTATNTAVSGTHKHVIIGYWHDFDNGSGFIPLTQVSNNFDIIDVAFAAPNAGVPNGEQDFAPYNETTAQFQADIATMHSRGKKVLISTAGYNGSTFTLSDTTSMNNFINSMENIISTYGFDGMDIDWEQNVLSLNQGDTDITHPTTPDVVNSITAITTIHNHFGANFMLTYGMETFFVQLGYSFYGGTCISCDRRAGSLLPVLYATRSFTSYVAVQLYNSGPITALDNNSYTNGGPDFLVAMTDMLLHGFPVAGTGQTFPALPPSQVAIGVPASTNAASAYVPPSGLEQAFDYLDRGISYGGQYKLTNSAGYPGLAGFMTWSINWDQLAGFAFSNPIRSYLDSLPN